MFIGLLPSEHSSYSSVTEADQSLKLEDQQGPYKHNPSLQATMKSVTESAEAISKFLKMLILKLFSIFKVGRTCAYIELGWEKLRHGLLRLLFTIDIVLTPARMFG